HTPSFATPCDRDPRSFLQRIYARRRDKAMWSFLGEIPGLFWLYLGLAICSVLIDASALFLLRMIFAELRYSLDPNRLRLNQYADETSFQSADATVSQSCRDGAEGKALRLHGVRLFAEGPATASADPADVVVCASNSLETPSASAGRETPSVHRPNLVRRICRRLRARAQ
ncbi:unnamed protein product, partial [Amoebophrya sp. A120]